MKKSLLIALLFFSFIHVFAQKDYQPGYILLNNGDTLNGYILDAIKSGHNHSACSFKSSLESEAKEYAPFEIIGYQYSNNIYYVSKHVPYKNQMKDLFLEYLVKGRVNLYYYNKSPEKIYYIEKFDGQLIPLTSIEKDTLIITNIKNIERRREYAWTEKNYIDSLAKVFEDCPEINKELLYLNFTHKDLINISKDYHEYMCEPGESCIVYEKAKNKKTNFGVFLSYNYSTFSIRETMYPYYYQINYPINAYYPGIGFVLSLKPSYWRDKFSVSWYSDFSKQTFTADSLGEELNEYPSSLKTLCWNNSFVLELTPHPDKKFISSLFVGANLQIQKISEQDLLGYTIDGVDADIERNSPVSKIYYGPEGGIKAKYKISQKNSLFLVLSYAYLMSNYSYYQNFKLKCGFEF